MAYDAHAAYQPPGRPYYGQAQQQQAPVQHAYGNQQQEHYDNYAQGGYDREHAQYGHGYVETPQEYGGSYQDVSGYSQGAGGYQQQQYADGYQGGYQRQQSRPISGEKFRSQPQPQPQQQQSQYRQQAPEPQYERNYDPRYQQRPGKAGPQMYGESPGQSAQPTPPPAQRQPPPIQQQPQGYQQRAQNESRSYGVAPVNQTRPTEPPNGFAQARTQRERPPADPRMGRSQPSPARVNGSGQSAMQQPQAAQPQKAKKMTMEEWKASEKAKMHAAAASPSNMPQDNAFPIFPNVKKEKLKVEDRSGGASAMSQRSSEEQSRSSIASSGPKHGEHLAHHEQRPSIGRDHSYQRDLPSQHQPTHLAPKSRPSLDHQPFSYEPIQEPAGSHQSPPPAEQRPVQRPPYERQLSGQQRSAPPPQQQQQSMDYRRNEQWHAQNAQPRIEQHSPPRAQGYGNPSRGMDRDLKQRQEHQYPMPQQPRPGTATGRPAIAAIDTAQARRPQPAYMDHQPLSPAQVPPRPNTAQAGRSPSGNLQVVASNSPLSQYSYTRTPAGYSGSDSSAVPKPWSEQQQQHNAYDADPEPQSAAPRTDDQIDADMPDFDSAAPQQTSMLHKKSVKSAQAPMQHAVQSASALSNPKVRQYGQPSNQYQDMANHKQHYASPVNAGFDFAVPQQPQQQQYHDPPQNGYDHAYHQIAPPVQPPQPPFANEPPVRRSFDDARQMPYRQAPTQAQRIPQNVQPPRDRYPPQQPHPRPDIDRNYSAQTVWSDPGQRVPSAPPLQQGLREPPGRPPNGVPLTQQRSAPEYEQQRHSNPDALPHHPVPVRPGLMENGTQQPAKPPPMRNYNNAAPAGEQSHARQASVERPSQPVTHAELDQLRAAVSASPNNNRQALLLAKKLVEASKVLASEGGRADPKTTAKNREKYILEAHKRIKKLTQAGYPDAQFYLADCYGQGSLGLEVDTKEAFTLYQAAAKQGHPQAAYRTAVCCEMGPEEGGGTRRDYPKAVQWYRRASALGDVAAMYKLGIVLLKSLLGQQRNVGEALTWLKRAAEGATKENPHALHELGTLFESSNTDPEVRNKIVADDKYAKELYTQAAQMGYKFSQFRLGQAYEYGSLGLPMDNRASISWYTKAASQGEHQAELALSGWYLTGAEGILEHSDTEAYLWARKAAMAEPPLAKAMFAMGHFSETGIGCPANMDEARKWYGRAASYRFPKALERLEELKKTGKARPAPVNGKLSRKDQKRDEENCTVM